MTRLAASALCVGAAFAAACSSGGGGGGSPHDASTDSKADVVADVAIHRDARLDHGQTRDAADSGEDVVAEAEPDGPIPTVALVRLANWSSDAPGIDLCVALHGTTLWSGPLLAASLGQVAVGDVVVANAGLPMDAGAKRDATVTDAAKTDGSPMEGGAGDAAADAHDGGAPTDAARDGVADGSVDSGVDGGDAGPPTGVLFPAVSPYLAFSPGIYDVRVVAAGGDCSAPLFPDVVDLPPLRAGAVETFAAVGDTVDQGADPPLGLSVLADDTTVTSTGVALRFIDAIPSVIEATFASGQVSLGTAMAYVAAAQFGGAGVDTDAGAVDPNGYVALGPIAAGQIWSLINANGGTTTLVTVTSLGIGAGKIATVVGVGGKSGASQYDIGVLVCIEDGPVAAGETASCTLLEEASLPVCALDGGADGAGAAVACR